MWSLKVLYLLGTVTLAFATVRTANYTGYKTYRLVANNNEQLSLLKKLNDEGNVDFWSNPRSVGKNIDIMVRPALQSQFIQLVNSQNIPVSVLIDDVERVLAKERQENSLQKRAGPGKISFNQYYRYDDIVDYLVQLADDYPELATVDTIGTTSEGRDIRAIKISSGGNGQRPALYIEAGIHAREWIAPAVALYLINQLVENNADNKALTDKIDWIITPVTNPDGYEYTHTNDRFWRKNRAPGTLCKGVDVNRNFGFHWGEEGASTNPCSETYRGSKAFSELESAAHRDYASANNDGNRIQLYIALHSYGPYFLYPWGYQWDLPDDWEDLDSLARDSASAIEAVAGTEYEIGSSTQLLYAASGGSDDYMKGGENIKYAYTVELPGGGSQGFDPPPSKIIPIVTETFEGLSVVGQFFSKSNK